MPVQLMPHALSRLAAPGLFRLCLALLVFVDHTTRLNLGRTAVFIFFVLSGYWIEKMWAERYARGPYWAYLVSRFWRLIPVFALSSGLAWMLLLARGALPPLDAEWPRQLVSNLFVLGYDRLLFRANGPAWSLDIEMQFYLVAPLLISAIAWSRWFLLPCLIVSASALFYGQDQTLLPYIGFFALGVAFALVDWVPSPGIAGVSLLGSCVLVLACLGGPCRDLLLGGAHPGPLHAYADLGSLVLGLCMAPWALFTTKQAGSPRDRMYGDLSFVVYLLHWPLIQAFDTGVGSPLERCVSISEVLIVTLGTSLLIWRCFDRPLDRLRSTWVATHIGRAGLPVRRRLFERGSRSRSGGFAPRT